MMRRRIKIIWAFLICAESIYLVVSSIINGITFFSVLECLIDITFLGQYEILFLLGISKLVLVWWGLTEQECLKSKTEFVFFSVVAIFFSASALIIYLLYEVALKIVLFWIVETIFNLTLTIMFLVGMKRGNAERMPDVDK